MSIKFITTTALACSLAFALSACSAVETAPANDMASSNGDYVKTSKPGAAVEFRYNAAELGTDNGSRDVKVQISEGYDSGILTVQVIQNDNLSVSGGSGTYTFDMSSAQPHEIILTVNPLSTGKHFLNLNAIAEYGQGQAARANYAVPIYAGVERVKRRINTESDAPEKISNPGVIILEAEEEIITETPK